MRSIVFACTLLLATACNMAYAQPKELTIGQPIVMADVAMPNVDGRGITMKSEMGKMGLLVIFSCNTCPFVIKNQEVTKQAIAYARAHGFGVVILNSNEAQRTKEDAIDAMQKYAGEQGYNVPYLADIGSRVADAFGANHTPEVYLFNNNGILVYKGGMNDNPGNPKAAKKNFLINAMAAAATGKTPDPAETKSVGCSIKRRA